MVRAQNNRRRVWTFLALSMATIVLLHVFSTNAGTTKDKALATAILIVGLVPSFIYLYRREANIPFLPVWGVVFAVYYAIPIFIQEDFRVRENLLADDAVTDSLWIALAGSALLVGAFYTAPRGRFKLLPRLRVAMEPSRAATAAVALSSIGLVVSFTTELGRSSSLQAVYSFVGQWPLLGIGILLMLFFRGELSFGLKIYLWLVLFPLVLLKDLGTGFLANPLRDILLVFFMYWVVKRRIPIGAILFCLLLLVPLFAVKQEFRDKTWDVEDADEGLISNGVTFLQMASKRITGGTVSADQSSLVDATRRRTACLMTLAFVVQKTPGEVPYWNGETYSTLATSLIPRFLWPDKPSKSVGQEFGHRYDLLDYDDLKTSVNLPQLAELYANFGWIAVILGMPLIGLMYRVVYEILNHENAGTGGFVVAGLVFVGLMNIESDLAGVFGGIVQMVIACVVVLQVFGGARLLTGWQLRKKSAPAF